MATPSVYKNTQQHSSVLSAQNVSLAHTTCVPICARTRTSARLYVRFVGRHLPDSTTGSATKDCTLAKRNSSARVTSRLVGSGAVAGDSPERMRLADISDQKPVGFVSSPY